MRTLNNNSFQEWLDELKSKINIVSVISKYIPLNQKGRSFWGLCPFHHEKTPSFSVNPDGQFYHCFGCSVSGDAISFVKEIEGIDFMDAVKMLAGQVNMQVPETSGKENNIGEKEKKDKHLKLLKDAANYYHTNLSSDRAEEANKYILKRGMDKETVKKFGIGYSLGFNEIIDYLKAKGYTLEMMSEVGIVDSKDGKYYDSLGGRLIFPICDIYGQVIAFGGRLLEKKDFAKYKNTRETSLFIKNRTLYGLHLVKKIKLTEKVESIIMVEGYMDTIALVSAGIGNVVASMGTSLTTQQAKLLHRQVDKVYIAYDGDSAGQKATIRGLEILYNEGLDVRVVTLPDDMDPDDTIRKHGKEGFQKLLDKALPLIEYKLEFLKKFYDVTTVEGKVKYASQAIRVLKELENKIEMEAYLEGISKISKIHIDTLKIEMNSNETVIDKLIAPTKISTAGYESAEKYILYAMLNNKAFVNYDEDIKELLDSDIYLKIYKFIMEIKVKNKQLIPSMIFDIFEEADKPKIMDILEYPEEIEREKEHKYYEDCLKRIKKEHYENKISELSSVYDMTEEKDKQSEILNKIKECKLKIRS